MSTPVHWMASRMADSMTVSNYLASVGRRWLPPQSAITFDDHLPCQIRRSRAMFSSHLKSKINLCIFLQYLTCLYQQSMFALLMSLGERFQASRAGYWSIRRPNLWSGVYTSTKSLSCHFFGVAVGQSLSLAKSYWDAAILFSHSSSIASAFPVRAVPCSSELLSDSLHTTACL